jgi:hypothetical protein
MRSPPRMTFPNRLFPAPSRPGFSNSRRPACRSPRFGSRAINAVTTAQPSNVLTRPFSPAFTADRDEASPSEAAAVLSIARSGRWKAGDEGSSRFKVHLAGEPMPLAIQCDAIAGWVRVLVTCGESILGEPVKIWGRVTLVEINE